MIPNILGRFRGQIRGVAALHPLLSEAYTRLRGVRERQLRVRDRSLRFLSGPRECEPPFGVDLDGRYEGPFVDRLAGSIADTVAAGGRVVFFDVGAAVGFESLIAHTFGAAELHLFAPDPVPAYFLERNLANIPHALNIEFHERIIRDELRLGDAVVERFFATLRELGYQLAFNGHQYEMVTGSSGRYNDTWYDQPPQHVNFAVHASPPPAANDVAAPRHQPGSSSA